MCCPQCKSEFRTGFTRCADCGVDLVEHLSQDFSDEDGNVATDSAGRQLLWSGMSSKFVGGICKALDAAKIEHVETTKEFGLLPTTMERVSFVWVAVRDHDAARSILDRMFADPGARDLVKDEEREERRGRAKGLSRVIDDRSEPPERGALTGLPRIFGGVSDGSAAEVEEESGDSPDSPGGFSLPMADSDMQDDDEPAPDDLIEDFHPDDATADVWAGEDSVMAENLSMCLRNVGVGCVLREDGAKSRLSVLPAQEKRAHEVVRQVLDAT